MSNFSFTHKNMNNSLHINVYEIILKERYFYIVLKERYFYIVSRQEETRFHSFQNHKIK